MKKIDLNYMRPGLCPFCGVKLPQTPIMLQLPLSDGSMMPQPVCESDLKLLQEKEGQDMVLLACKAIWMLEISENTQRTEKERVKEIERIMNLKITSA